MITPSEYEILKCVDRYGYVHKYTLLNEHFKRTVSNVKREKLIDGLIHKGYLSRDNAPCIDPELSLTSEGLIAIEKFDESTYKDAEEKHNNRFNQKIQTAQLALSAISLISGMLIEYFLHVFDRLFVFFHSLASFFDFVGKT